MQRRPFFLGLATLVLAPLAACSKNDEAAPPAAPARKMSGIEAYAIAGKGSGFTMGPVMAANTVYVFFDTTCPHCAELWNASQPLLGKLKMVWMPIGLLRPSSLPQGATILSAADPAKAMTENETSVLARGGGPPSRDRPRVTTELGRLGLRLVVGLPVLHHVVGRQAERKLVVVCLHRQSQFADFGNAEAVGSDGSQLLFGEFFFAARRIVFFELFADGDVANGGRAIRIRSRNVKLHRQAFGLIVIRANEIHMNRFARHAQVEPFL